jgi:hypothetical protein
MHRMVRRHQPQGPIAVQFPQAVPMAHWAEASTMGGAAPALAQRPPMKSQSVPMQVPSVEPMPLPARQRPER